MPPDPKPRKRIIDKAATRRKQRVEGWRCRIPDCPHWSGGCHHIVERGSPHFGDDVEDNLVPLCGSGTTGHHGKVEAFDEETCRALVAALRPAELAYVYERLGRNAGEAYLARRYKAPVRRSS